MQTNPVPSGDHDDHGDGGGLLPTPAGPGSAVAYLRNQELTQQLREREVERDKDDIDLLHYWHILLKRRWTVLATLGIVLATALVATLLMTPIYRSTVLLQVDRDTIQVVEVEGMAPMEGG